MPSHLLTLVDALWAEIPTMTGISKTDSLTLFNRVKDIRKAVGLAEDLIAAQVAEIADLENKLHEKTRQLNARNSYVVNSKNKPATPKHPKPPDNA